MSPQAAKRPWLAAVLGLMITGLGHLYLREWTRALLWLAMATLAAVFFVPDGAIADTAIVDLIPIMVVVVMSVIDAYLLGRQHNRRLAVAQRQRCPHCGKEMDLDVSFCWYCAAELPRAHEPSELE